MAISFDKFFLHLPQLERNKNFREFWKDSISELKRTAMEPQTKLSTTHSKKNFLVYDVNFRSFAKTVIQAHLYIPDHGKNFSPIIVVHDYNNQDSYSMQHLDTSCAYLFLKLRNHQHIVQRKVEEKIKKGQLTSPGFLIENIIDKDSYYLRGVYLDVFRAIDFLRLTKTINCDKIGIIGKGLGAACAVFAAAFSNRVKAIVVDSPSFFYLNYFMNHAKNEIANEINSFLSEAKSKRAEIKENLSYFDGLNFADMIEIPVLASTGLKDTAAPPQCTFAFFNHLITDKTVEVYPDADNECGGPDMWKKGIAFIKKEIITEV